VFDFSKANEIYAIGFSETEDRILQLSDLIDLEKMIAEKKRRHIEK
jgi:NTE family protein